MQNSPDMPTVEHLDGTAAVTPHNACEQHNSASRPAQVFSTTY